MACSKIFSGDLPELINEIIQYFQNDYSTLYSCILVNRLWCRLAIPLLWKEPFSKDFPENYHFIHIIDIYLQKLNDDDKIKLNEYGMITNLFSSNTLFNYPSFIKCLSIRDIISSIKSWIVRRVSKFNKEPRFLFSFVFISLIKIFIKNDANLHTFEISWSCWMIDKNSFNSILQLISQNPNFINDVKILKIMSRNLKSFIKCLYSNCTSISSLHILTCDLVEKDLSRLIGLQQNPKKIYFSYRNDLLKSLKNSNCSNNLKTIIFYEINFENLKVNFSEVFDQLNVLESIHILYCFPLNSTIIQQIIDLTKPFKLKSLFVKRRSLLQIESLGLLLQKCGNYLENIGFEFSVNHEIKRQLFELAKIYCIKIKFLEILEFNDQNIFPALDLMKNSQQNLNYLNINFYQFGFDQLNYDNKLSLIILHNLGQILPYRLEYLGLALKFNINDLEIFFKNSQNVFTKKLLIRNKLYQDSENILPCIKKYIMKEKRVTYLAIENLLTYSNNEKEDLIDLKGEVEEFKIYGIQVKSYNKLHIQVGDLINELY